MTEQKTQQQEELEEKMLAVLIREYPELEKDNVINQNSLVEQMTTTLYDEALLFFGIEERVNGDGDNSWLQAEYVSNKLNGLTIIFDYEVSSEYGDAIYPEGAALKCFCEQMREYQEKIDAIEASINIIN